MGFLSTLENLSTFSKQVHTRAAYFDVLTGLLSRSAFTERGQKLLRESIVRHLPLTVMMLDIDHFKKINDKNGHATGDKVLIEFSRLVRDQLRESDLFGRIGGEEFAILLPNTPSHQAEKTASRIRERVEKAIFLGRDGVQLNVTVSIGLVDLTGFPSTSLDDLLHYADQSLYVAKSRGRNNVVSFKARAAHK
nr:GGDEF domain-containing protein [Brucella anthropi]